MSNINRGPYDSFNVILSGLRSAPRDRQGRLLVDVDYTFKVLVSLVGELAAINANYTNSTSDRDALTKVIGAMSSCIVAITDCYGIDWNSALATFLAPAATSGVMTGSASSEVATGRGGKVLTINSKAQPAQPDTGLLSPRTVNNFFPELDRYRNKAREDYQNELAWFVLLDNGEVFDLKPNGRNIPVTYDELQYYLTLAEIYRGNRTSTAPEQNRIINPSSVVASESTPVQRFTKTLQVNAPGYNGDQEAALFSPTHFDNGLFAPLNTQTSVQVEYGRGTTESPPARGNNSSQNRASSNSAAQSEMERFWSIIGKIERHELTGDEISQCSLSFSVPSADGSVVELITNGSKIRVTRNNVDSFIGLVKEKMNNPSTARVMRTGSIRPMVVTNTINNPIVDEGRFSPSHFTGNLFAPFSSNTAVNVDLNNEDLVPSVLRNGSQPNVYRDPSLMGGNAATAAPTPASTAPTSSAAAPTAAPTATASSIASALRNFTTNRTKPAVPSYADRIRLSDDEFVAILSQLDAEHERATEFGVTFCIPSACVNKAVLASNPSASSDGLFDLVPNGRAVPVSPAQVPQYFQMIEAAAKV